ncbi:MAG: Cache 3/Cache 2 fusion domain-containing protein, partial [Bacteroidetes bacterium]|nr:Cache 3/Cache 2 fusion domain-containing protein [Bacteroidota bacterium]
MKWILHSIRKRLSVKISLAILASTLFLLFAAGAIMSYTLSVRYHDQAMALMEDTNTEVRQSLDIVDELMGARVRSSIGLLRESVRKTGVPAVRGTVLLGTEPVPALYLGPRLQVNDADIVDHVKELTDATATIFVRRGSEFIRISTNVKKGDGTRALGTRLDPAGKAYQSIMAGHPFYGVVSILGKPYYTAYEPLTDGRGSVLGVLYTGYPIASMKFVEELINEHVVLQNGFIALLNNANEVLFKGSHVNKDLVVHLTTRPEERWTVRTFPYEPWGYTIVAAYPNSDVTGLLMADVLWIFIGTVIMSVITVLVLNLSLKKLVVTPLQGIEYAAGRISVGDTDVDIHTASEDELGNVANAFQTMIDGIKTQSRITKAISEGHLNFTVKVRSDQDQLNISLQKVIDTLHALGEESKRMCDAAIRGELSVRGRTEGFKGKYHEIVTGMNRTLDAVIGPLHVAATYVDRIAKGDIPNKITDSYNGDFNEIKNNLNTCIDAVNALVADANMLALAAVEGRLNTRADAAQHHGDYRRIVQGVNDTLDSVIRPLNVAAVYVDRISKGDIPAKITDNYNGDFNTIKNNLNTCIDAVNALVADANMLALAAVEGRLNTRADASKHGGDFRKIVQGVNDTLDSVIGPLNVAAKYVDDISKGAIPAKITDNYNGDFNTIKNNL